MRKNNCLSCAILLQSEVLMTAGIWYFSGTGNSWWVAHRLGDILTNKGLITEVRSIERAGAEETSRQIEAYDIIGFVYPIYGSDLPLIMKEFLASLPCTSTEKPVFLCCTQWLFSGDGTRAALEFLEGRHFNVRWSEHISMPNNVCISLIRLPYSNDRRKIGKFLGRAERRLERFAEHIFRDMPRLKGFSRWSAFLGSLQRSPFRKYYDRLRNDIAVDPSRCTSCGLCVEICPSRNLSMAEDGRIAVHGKCILCVRCYNFCPASAVTYMGRKHIMERGVPYRGPEPCSPADIIAGKHPSKT